MLQERFKELDTGTNSTQVLPSGNARHSMEFYAATKNRQEACLEHRPTTEAYACAGVRIDDIQFLGYLYGMVVMLINISSCRLWKLTSQPNDDDGKRPRQAERRFPKPTSTGMNRRIALRA